MCSLINLVTLLELFTLYASGQLDGTSSIPNELVSAVINCLIGKSKQEMVRVSTEVKVGEAVSSLGQFIEYQVPQPEEMTCSTLTDLSSPVVNATTVLLQAARDKTSLPKKWNPSNAKLKLKNSIIDWLSRKKLGWEAALANQTGLVFVNTVGDALWYINRKEKTLSDRSMGVPCDLQQFMNFKQPEKYKHRKIDCDSLNESELRSHSLALFTLVSSSYMKAKRWKSVCEVLTTLASNLQQYASYLVSQNETTKKNHARTEVRSDVDEILVIHGVRDVDVHTPCYGPLHQALSQKDNFDVIFINEFAPPDPKRRYEYMKGLIVPGKCVKYTYTAGRNHLHFLWKVPPDSLDSEVLNKSMKIHDELKKNCPVYHSRAMQREFVHVFGKLTHSKPAFLREAYHRLTGDCSASSNLTEDEVDERIAQLIDSEDPDLVWDLRSNNEGRPETYGVFLDCCKKYIDSQIDTAVDDRRHDTVMKGNDVVTHLAVAMSASDFHEQVVKICPENTPIPSVQWLRLQFWPRRSNAGFAKHQNGRLPIKFMIQARQFRKSHIDAHYASALFRYEKEFAVRYRDYCTLVSMDDKHTVKVGEPGSPVAGVERGRQVLVSISKKLVVSDHDFTKFSLTPSVSFLINIPESMSGSFYTGKVFVGIKENCFEPSSPLRHVTELSSVLQAAGDINPMLLIYTDGGPDHRLTYVSVQVSLICIFLALDLDFLCAVRTPPYHSWKNPAERVMSILNLGIQSIGIMRQETTSYEEKLKSCNNLGSIRLLGERHPDLSEEVLDSVEPVKTLLQGIFARLKLKDHNFQSFQACSNADMEDMWQKILTVDGTLNRKNLRKEDISSKTALLDFLQVHCKIRHYMFSIKKCNLPGCVCNPPRLPVDIFNSLHHLPDPIPNGDHYLDFESLYGKDDTTEEHCPSKKLAEKKGSGMPFTPTAQYARNVDVVIQCHECEKWRLLYAKNVVTRWEKTKLEKILEEVQYSCGSSLQDIDDESSILCRVFTRTNLLCSSPMEIPYYGTYHEPLCFYCGCSDVADDEEDDLQDKYPICNNCLHKKPAVFKRKRQLPSQSSGAKKRKKITFF